MLALAVRSGGSAPPMPIDDSRMNRLLAVLMDRIECGMLACGPRGELLHANLAARRELQGGRIMRLVDGIVCCVCRSSDAWIGALHEAAMRHRSTLLELIEGSERITAAISPAAGESDAVAMVVLGRRQACSALGLQMLATSRGLTIAEQNVLRDLVASRTVREIAATHGVAVATVRSQIQAIRDKLGVRSIDALLLLAAELPPITARH